MTNNPNRNVERTWAVFFRHYGDGPWVCIDCDTTILKLGVNTWDGNIHHLDGDVANDTPKNLLVLHTICHQHRHPITDELKDQISKKLKGRPSPTKGMKFPNRKHVDVTGIHNPFYGKQHSSDSLKKMRQPRKRFTCDDCGEDWSKNWIERHKKEGKCIQRRVITLNGIQRVRGILPKSICINCNKPYAQRWMQRHKDENRCIAP